jgi:tyrosyl-tRNA synthetase
MKNFIEELKWRGMLQDMTPGIEEQLQKEMTTAYIGYDPTAASLHIGNLATIMLLKHFQLSGHKPVALVGGATGMVGDPSGKSEERKLLNEEVLRHNQSCIKKQLEHFLDFEKGPNAAEMVNNFDWFSQFGFLGFLRDVGKHITVNYMMAKDSVKKRLETGISFTEFSYQLMQGYDYYHLYKNKGVKLQMGGSDQWGNITTGTEFIRKMDAGEAFALTTPLVTKPDGSKFGKSEEGNIWLDPEMTSPYKFYQFWLNISDEEASRMLKVYSLLEREMIESLEKEHQKAPEQRLMQKALAEDITVRVHSREDYDMSVKASQILFGKSTAQDLESLSEKMLLAVFEGVPQVNISGDQFTSVSTVTDLLSEVSRGEIFSSKGEARRMINSGAVSINKIKVPAPDQPVDFQLIRDRYLLVQKGKRNYYLLKVEG